MSDTQQRTVGEIWALVDTVLDRGAVPVGAVYIGKNYTTAELRDDLREVIRLLKALGK